VAASESCALDIVNATAIAKSEAGEIVAIDDTGVRSITPFRATDRRQCVFEYVYFSRPIAACSGDRWTGRGVRWVGNWRGNALHRRRARVQRSRLLESAALGFAEQSGFRCELALSAITTSAARSSAHAGRPRREGEVKYNAVREVLEARVS
jgi:amidophosphoribosyltransferase